MKEPDVERSQEDPPIEAEAWHADAGSKAPPQRPAKAPFRLANGDAVKPPEEGGDTPFNAGHPASFIVADDPVYGTARGAAYACDGLELLSILPNHSVEAVITSPPYALEFKKEYGNVAKADYVRWLLPFAREIKRVLKKDGSFILNIGGKL
jgi:hypothetical protein